MPIPPISRRAFLATLAASSLAGTATVHAANQPRVVGYLSGGQGPEWLAKALAERGYVDGRNLRIETRIPPDWDAATLKLAAEDLVAQRPDVLFAVHGNRVGALSAATRTIPIVTGGVPDPIGMGFAKTLRRPGGNITGLSFGLPETADITMGLFKTLRPGLKRVGVVLPAGLPPSMRGTWWVEVTQRHGLEWVPLSIAPGDDLERALLPLAGQATLMAPVRDPALGERACAAATRLRTMTMGMMESGAMMNYGLDHEDSQGRVGAILDQVLRGANPGEIPFEVPSKSSFELSRKVARAVGVEIPPDVLLRVTHLLD